MQMLTNTAARGRFSKSGIAVLFRKSLVPLFFVVMVIVFDLIKSQYLSFENIKSIILQASMLGIIASGMTIVMMTGGADLSVGSIAGLAAISGLWWVAGSDMPLVLGLGIGLFSGAAVGLINGVCVALLGIAPFVATLGTMFLAQGFQYLISAGGQSISYGFPGAFLFMGTGAIAAIPMPIIIFVVTFLVMFYVTEMTPTGRYLRATGLNQSTAELSGVKIRKYTIIAYVASGLLSAVLGLVLAAFQSYVSPTHGDSFLMDSLIVALLGKALFDGKLTMQGTLFGALFLRSFETGLSMLGIPVTVLNVSKGVLLVAILMMSLLKKNKQARV